MEDDASMGDAGGGTISDDYDSGGSPVPAAQTATQYNNQGLTIIIRPTGSATAGGGQPIVIQLPSGGGSAGGFEIVIPPSGSTYSNNTIEMEDGTMMMVPGTVTPDPDEMNQGIRIPFYN